MPKIITLPWVFGFDGWTVSPYLIFVKPGVSNALIQHEICHTEQMKRDGWFRWAWRYNTSKAWRRYYEAYAYARQVASGADLATCAWWLAERYRLDISVMDAESLIKECLTNSVPQPT